MTKEEFQAIIARWHLAPKMLNAVTGITEDQQKNYRFGRTAIPPRIETKILKLNKVLAKFAEE